MNTSYRTLEPADIPTIDAFLVRHRDSSMVLRSNLHRVGVSFKEDRYHGIYVGAFRNQQLRGIAAHYWNGMLVLQAPEYTVETARACVDCSGRKVTGFAGPLEQVRLARAAMDLASAPARMEEDEWLYGLDLSDLVVPAMLSTEAVTCRFPKESERDLLCAWRLAYDIELLGATDSTESRQRAADFLDAQIAEKNAWVAVQDGQLVSLSALNATLPDIVQLGGIYTPPELRGRGYAKAAVAASLLGARERGAQRAVLYTSNPSAARSYEALGFRRLGDYGLVLLR